MPRAAPNPLPQRASSAGRCWETEFSSSSPRPPPPPPLERPESSGWAYERRADESRQREAATRAPLSLPALPSSPPPETVVGPAGTPPLTSEAGRGAVGLSFPSRPPPSASAEKGGRRRRRGGMMEAVRGRGGGGGRGVVAAAGASPSAAAASSVGPGACGCKGSRRCLLCEEAAPPPQKRENFVYCVQTGLAVGEEQSEFAGWAFPFPGVFLLEDFISPEEESKLVELMDKSTWKPSQSGRRKQDYGPKVNFKKRKLKAADFSGLPAFSQELVTRMKNHSPLADFSPVEQCNLDYGPERGSAIDPHLDDWWLWGERLVSMNLLSSTILSMSCDSEDSLQLFPASLSKKEQMCTSGSPPASQNHHRPTSLTSERLGNSLGWVADYSSSTKLVPSKNITVAIHLPRRSLVVLYGPARYEWKHAIYRDHITSRRICVTFRELSQEFSDGGEQEELGRKLLHIALTFQGTLV